MNSAIYNFIDEIFSSKDGNPEIFKLDSFDSDGAPLIDAFDFVNSDYYDDDNDAEYLFSWTGEEYYKTIYAQGDITKFEYEGLVSKSPTSEILDKDAINSLNSYFGDLWKPVFKQWFKDKTGMDYKTLYLN
jgi:uncharacterized membrane protein